MIGVALFCSFHGQAYYAFVACLSQHVAYVETDGASGDVEDIGDFLVGFVFTYPVEDVQFSLGEAGVVEAEGGSLFDIGEDVLSFEGPFYAGDEVTGGAFFVDEAVGTCFLGHFHKVDVGKACHDDDFLSWQGFLDSSGHFDAAGASFHTDIHEDNVRLHDLGGHFGDFREGQDFDYLNAAGVFKEVYQSIKENSLVIYYHHTNHGHFLRFY